MQQHPVPQEISTYEFRLVGDMTLKQFLQLASGAGIAFLLFVSPIPGIVKWPLIIFSALFGVILAFLPIEERPVSVWIFAFLKAIYSPTQYVFRHGGAEEVFSQNQLTPVILTPQGEERARQYLEEIPRPQAVSTLEEQEKTFFQKIRGLFGTTLRPVGEQATVGLIPEPVATAPPIAAPAPRTGQTPFVVEEVIEKTAAGPKQPPTMAVPHLAPIRVERIEKQAVTASVLAASPPVTTRPVAPVFTKQQVPTGALQATFTPEAAPPNPPSVPNTVVGQVLSQEGAIVENAILEVRDQQGIPKRALRTNKIGHFLSVTPLENGQYEIETEKEGYLFDTVKFKAEGSLIPPILIKAKSAQSS